MNNYLSRSAKLALIMGILLPIAETVRRSNQISDLSNFWYWFDDYILGGTLLAGWFLYRSKKLNAVAYLIASWGICVGALFLSLLGQLSRITQDTPDPGILSNHFVFVGKGLILAYMLYGLYLAIKANSELLNK